VRQGPQCGGTAERQSANGRATVAVTEPVSYRQNSAARSDSLSVCQYRLTLFSSARLRLSLARACARGESVGNPFDHKPHTLTKAQKEALKVVGHLVIANFELRRDLQELRDALAARDAAEGPSGALPANLDEIISRLQGVASDLQAVREGRRYEREPITRRRIPIE
jgi:hypothetical protein